MKLLTTIKPRTDGAVIVRDSTGKPHVFKRDDEGLLVCDIEDPALVGRLLLSNSFAPLDDADHQAAEQLMRDAGGGDDEQGDDDDGFDGDPDEVPPGSLPVEANTPPVAAARPRAARAPRAAR